MCSLLNKRMMKSKQLKGKKELLLDTILVAMVLGQVIFIIMDLIK